MLISCRISSQLIFPPLVRSLGVRCQLLLHVFASSFCSLGVSRVLRNSGNFGNERDAKIEGSIASLDRSKGGKGKLFNQQEVINSSSHLHISFNPKF